MCTRLSGAHLGVHVAGVVVMAQAHSRIALDRVTDKDLELTRRIDAAIAAVGSSG